MRLIATRLAAFSVLVPVALVAVAAAAAPMPPMKPGLWEARTSVLDANGKEITPPEQAALARMTPETKARMAEGLKDKVWPLLEAGTVRPIIYKTFALKDAALAHAELERADHVGKVMMTV